MPSRLPQARADAAAIAHLAGPLLVNNLATAGMVTADTVMAGWLFLSFMPREHPPVVRGCWDGSNPPRPCIS